MLKVNLFLGIVMVAALVLSSNAFAAQKVLSGVFTVFALKIATEIIQ